MKTVASAMVSRSLIGILAIGVGIATVAGCSDDDRQSAVPLLVSGNAQTSVSEPEPIGTAPTLAPVDPGTTTPREVPDFSQVTPPPLQPDLPDQPTGSLNALQSFAFNQYEVVLSNLVVRGVIADVDIQVLNNTCGTDVTEVLNPTAVAQFESLLVGRGNTVVDATGFDFNFQFPTDPEFFADGRILSRGNRTLLTVDAEGEPSTEEFLTGDEIIVIVTITDTFGQVLRLNDGVFEEGDDRLGLPCGFLVSGGGAILN